jgi:hypothetical protein
MNTKINFCKRILLMQTMQLMVTSTKSITTCLPPVGTSTTLKRPVQNHGHKMKEWLITHHISLKEERQ